MMPLKSIYYKKLCFNEQNVFINAACIFKQWKGIAIYDAAKVNLLQKLVF